MRQNAGVIASIFVISVSAFGQHGGHGQQQTRVTIDGSQTPQLVTDAEAFNVWFIALAAPNDLSPEASRRLAAKLSPLAITAHDTAVVDAALAAFKAKFDQIAGLRAQLSSGAAAGDVLQNAQTLRTAEDELVAATRATLQADMSAAGWYALNSYVLNHVKSRIKIYEVEH